MSHSEGVELVTKTRVPAVIALPDIDVAAMLFSMIDEALEKCRAQLAENPSAKPTINVRALTEKDELLIDVECTRLSGGSKKHGKARRTGSQDEYEWDSKVVDNLVRGHGGLVERAERDGLTRTTIMIPLRHREQSGE